MRMTVVATTLDLQERSATANNNDSFDNILGMDQIKRVAAAQASPRMLWQALLLLSLGCSAGVSRYSTCGKRDLVA